MISNCHDRTTTFAAVFLRLALAASFLSAVADRFGWWGPPGTPGVAWGAFDPFLVYTGQLLWFLPDNVVRIAGWTATIAEILLAIGLMIGVWRRVVAFASGLLLLTFAIAMTAAHGPESAFTYSVWTAAAGAFLLASLQPAGTKTPSDSDERGDRS